MDVPSLDGRVFIAVANEDGEVGPHTRFEYHEHDNVVWSRYGGGAVRLGFLVGTRSGDRLEIRYVQLNDAGDTATGRCSSDIEVLDDGRLRLREAWAWESSPGTGTSVVEEVYDG